MTAAESLELRKFGNALREFLDLDPLWDDGREAASARAKLNEQRFFRDPAELPRTMRRAPR